MNRPNPASRITLERTFRASLAEVWALWTTAEGIASWWGPEGFTVTVQHLDLRPGGALYYTMVATAPEMVAYMQQAGMPTEQPCKITYAEVVPYKRLSYIHLVDFVPEVTAYDTETVVELHPTAHGVRMVLTLDPMHAPEWTQRAVMGWESELGKLAARITALAPALTPAPQITPMLWYNFNAEEAVALYLSLFPEGRVLETSHYREGGHGPAGALMTVTFEVAGQRLIALNGGPQYRFTEAVSLMVRCETQEEVDTLWARLTDGGEEGPCGWLKDRYGLSWQIVPTALFEVLAHPDPAAAQRAMAAMFNMKKLDISALRAAAAGA